MEVKDFDYELKEELIAQVPLKKRDSSRLMVVDRKTGAIKHQKFTDILSYFHNGDVLVLNDTKVLPARLLGEKLDTKAAIEVLLLKNIEKDTWEALVKPARRVKLGTIISFGGGLLTAKCTSIGEEGIREFVFSYQGIFYEILDKLGTMPLPPYIHEQLENQNRYQTVYAKEQGSAAAPTAGLHFTKELLDEIKKKGVTICTVTLHVGLGTFRPVKVEKIENHEMHSEYYQMSKVTADILNDAKKNHQRIISVGTTSTRTLESIMQKYGKFQECFGFTNIFIYPGYQFLAIDGLITNFHLPKSTLVMLVSAFATREIILNAYRIAVDEKYRFFSFGDSMFLTTDIDA